MNVAVGVIEKRVGKVARQHARNATVQPAIVKARGAYGQRSCKGIATKLVVASIAVQGQVQFDRHPFALKGGHIN